MKRILTTLVALALGMTAFAQYGPGRGGGMGYGSGRGGYYGPYFDRGSFEIGVSLNHFTGGTKDGFTVERPDRAGIFAEYRMDLGGFMDVGLQLNTTFGKGVDGAAEANFWQGAPLLVMDFNLLPYAPFNPYLGVGFGPGFGYEKIKGQQTGEWTHAIVLNPRAGVELFEHLRLSVQYQWYLTDSRKFSHVAFGFSYAFGSPMQGGHRPMRR